ncbi:cadherin-15 [Protopterus annectens]|uniref:cadherin-15 n=1 Tax=Protopterus annectens TaxID=7888 RepID=UPI001CFAA916|nr:cadherin-15 [Protopterus annectens]
MAGTITNCIALVLLGAVLAQASYLPEDETGESESIPVLHPWQQRTAKGSSLIRVKRAWVIPPIRVSENLRQIPQFLVQVKSDKQTPGSVLYSIKGPGVDEEPYGVFSIDQYNGNVSVNAVLDREKHEKFKLKVYAVDSNGKPLEDPTNLEIVVIDQNDNKPTFLQQIFTGRIPEGSAPGTLVAMDTKIEAKDDDDPTTENAMLKFSIIDHGNGAQIFSINEDTGEIRTISVGLDREKMSTYNLTLQVADQEGNGLTNTAKAVIRITDVNDNPPVFTAKQFFMQVVEHKGSVEVGRVSVADSDEHGSPNWRVKYTIIGGDPDKEFTIQTDPETNEGVLYVIKSLDHEKKSLYELIVTVVNENELNTSMPPAPSTAIIIVTVKDLNEEPAFLENPKIVKVPEHLKKGSHITTYTARDPDFDPQTLRYSIQYDPAKWLVIDPDTGSVTANREISRKSPYLTNNWYTTVIIATDDAALPNTATGTLSIHVLEVNDFAPIMFPLTATTCSETDKGKGVILSAHDEDMQPQAQPFYFAFSPDRITSFQNWTIVKVNDTHSRLELRNDVEEGLHILPIIVSDSGEPQQHSEALLNVTVCHCDNNGSCKPGLAAIFNSSIGLSFGALMIILASIILLLLLLLLVTIYERCRHREFQKGLLEGSDDDIRDNVLNYDEQGGGEEDQDAYDIAQLRNPDAVFTPPSPRGKQPIRKDAPSSYAAPLYPKRPLTNPNDIEDFINNGLDAADNDPNVPPYDTALIYDYEGDGSLAGSLSSIVSGSADTDVDYDYLNDWGPRFKKLADMYGEQ